MNITESISRNLRRIRNQSGLTLTGLSEHSGVAKSTLSQMENGEGNPTVETLWAIANALDISFGRLVEEEGGGSDKLRNEGEIVCFIEKSTGEPEIEVYSIDLQAGHCKKSAPHPRGVKERVTVLSGIMLVGDADRPRLIRAGESYLFDADIPHIYAATDQNTRAVVFIEYPSKAYSDYVLSTYIDWPITATAWDGVRSALDRALIEVANGIVVRVLRFREGGVRDKSVDKKTLIKELQSLKTTNLLWPLLVLVESDSQGIFVAIIRLGITSCFARSDFRTNWPNVSVMNTTRELAWLAESASAPLDEQKLEELLHYIEGDSWILNSLASEVLQQRGILRLPHQLNGLSDNKVESVGSFMSDQTFSSRINVEHYDAFELLHPAYARQVVALAEDLCEFADFHITSSVIDVGSGPGVPLLMLQELYPHLHFTAIEPDSYAFSCLIDNTENLGMIDVQQIDFLEFSKKSSSVSVITSVGASHHFNTAFMLQKAYTLLQPGGLLIVADEFLSEFSNQSERNLTLVRHHSAYILASMAWVEGEDLPIENRDVVLYRKIKSAMITAQLAATEFKVEQAVNICRKLFTDLRDEGIEKQPVHVVGFFVRFYWLELQAMVAGFDYEVERKTYSRRFNELAHLAGLNLLRHRRVFSTSGSDEFDSGTHVFTFSKPKTKDKCF